MANQMINTARSYYKTNPEVLTTFNTSFLIPLKCLKVIPNGTYKINAGTICRLPALKVPVMGKLYLEFFAFYVPYDVIDKNFEKFITEGHDNSFDEDTYGQGSHTPNTQSLGQSITPDLFTPKLTNSADGATGFPVNAGDLLNRLGLPIANEDAHKRSLKFNEDLKARLTKDGVLDEKEYKRLRKRVVPAEIPNDKFSALPVRGYYSIYNTHFRSKFLQDPLATDYGFPESNPKAFELQRVNRLADWFSRGFVSSQLYDVQVPLGVGTLPVVADSEFAQVGNIMKNGFMPESNSYGIHRDLQIGEPYTLEQRRDKFGLGNIGEGTNPFHFIHKKDGAYHTGNSLGTVYQAVKDVFGTPDSTGTVFSDYFDKVANIGGINPRVDLTGALALGLDSLRYVIGLSHISQKALYGTDMDTILKMNFNLVLPKTKLTEPLMFGYKRVPVEINQITQTAPSSDDSSNIGDVYGQSTTINRMDDGSFVFKSYNYGLIYLMCCVRHESVYQYGVDPIFTENDKFDLFQPDLQGLSNVGIPKMYIYFSGDDKKDLATFNFNEPYSELKYDHNVVNGEFASDSNTPLDFYHLADIYDDTPSYDDEWIKDTTKEVLDRALTITSENANQVQAYFKFTYERTLPMSDYFVGFDYI